MTTGFATELSEELTGKLLVAMPGMGDPRFAHSVIFMTAHSAKGAMGLIINKPAADLKLADVLDQLIEGSAPAKDGLGVYIGGPVETGRGFVLHSADYASAIETLKITPEFSLTATLDILEDIAKGDGPSTALMMLGYAGWGAGQLENEIVQNGWLVCPSSAGLVFDTDDGKKWSGALKSIGVDPLGLSAAAGHA